MVTPLNMRSCTSTLPVLHHLEKWVLGSSLLVWVLRQEILLINWDVRAAFHNLYFTVHNKPYARANMVW